MAGSERAAGWLNTIVPILEKGGPITTLILGLCAVAMIWAMYKELARVHDVSHMFFNKLESCYQAQLALARQCPPGKEER